jgi:hypothetical protein
MPSHAISDSAHTVFGLSPFGLSPHTLVLAIFVVGRPPDPLKGTLHPPCADLSGRLD